MKKSISFLIAVLFFSVAGNSTADPGIGRIIQLTGDVDLTEIDSGNRIIPDIGTQLMKTQKLRTGLKSYAEILLNDNTKIFIRELSVIQINSIRKKKKDPPAEIIFHLGKIRININKELKGRNLILKTNVAILGIQDIQTDFAVITTDYQTKLAVLEGQVDIASINREILKSYTVKTNEEVSIKQNTAPSEPVILPREILDSWLDYYYVVDKEKIRIKEIEESSIIDYILRKRKF